MADPVIAYTAAFAAHLLVSPVDTGSNTEAFTTTQLPVTAFSMEFALNRAPAATFVVPVGVNTADHNAPDVVSQLVGNVTTRFRVNLMFEARGTMIPGVQWPTTPFRLWAGYSAGITHLINQNTVNYSLTSLHWLSDLDSSILLSSDIVKSSHTDGLASVSMLTTAGDPGFVNVAVVAAAAHPLGNATDLWNDFAIPMFEVVGATSDQSTAGGLNATTLYDNVVTYGPAAQVTSAEARQHLADIKLGNTRALEVLEGKRNGTVDPTKNVFNDDRYITQGSLSLAAYDEIFIPDAVAFSIADVLLSAASGSVLSKVSQIAGLFQGSLVANVESATVAPLTPVFKAQSWWRVLQPSDYTFIEGSSFTPRLMSGVVMIGDNPLQTGGEYAQDPNDASATSSQLNTPVVGAYIGTPRGQLSIEHAPEWMRTYQPTANLLQTQVTFSGNHMAALRTAANDYAHARWINDAYSARRTMIRTQLRFDIAPGSSIRLNGLGLSGTGAVRPDTQSALNGIVEVVRVHVNTEQPSAATELVVSYLVTDEEKATYGADSHPIYRTLWLGAPLVKLIESDLQPSSVTDTPATSNTTSFDLFNQPNITEIVNPGNQSIPDAGIPVDTSVLFGGANA